VPLYRRLSDLSSVRLGQSVNADDQSTNALSHSGIERRLKIARGSHVDELGLKPRRARQRSTTFHSAAERVTHIEQESMRVIRGTISLTNSSCFPCISVAKALSPVTLPLDAPDSRQGRRQEDRRSTP